jgi:hypothetical protein
VQRTEIVVAFKYTTEHEGAAHRNGRNGRVNMAVRGHPDARFGMIFYKYDGALHLICVVYNPTRLT